MVGECSAAAKRAVEYSASAERMLEIAHQRHHALSTRSSALTRAVAARIHHSNLAAVFDLWIAALRKVRAERHRLERSLAIGLVPLRDEVQWWWDRWTGCVTLGRWEGKVEDVEAGRLAAEERWNAAEQARRELTKKLDELQEKLDAIVAQQEGNNLLTQESEADSLRQEAGDLKERLADAEAEVLDLQDDLEEEKSRVEELQDKLRSAQQALDDQQQLLMQEDRECSDEIKLEKIKLEKRERECELRENQVLERELAVAAEEPPGAAAADRMYPSRPPSGEEEKGQGNDADDERARAVTGCRDREVLEWSEELGREAEGLRQKEQALIVRMEAVMQNEEAIVDQETKLLSWEQMLVKKEEAIVDQEAKLLSWEQMLVNQDAALRQEDSLRKYSLLKVQEQQALVTMTASHAEEQLLSMSPPSLLPRRIPTDPRDPCHVGAGENGDAAADTVRGQVSEEGVGGKDKKARRAEILRLIGERDGLRIAKQARILESSLYSAFTY